MLYFNTFDNFAKRTNRHCHRHSKFCIKIMEIAPYFTDDFCFQPIHPLMMYFTSREHTFKNWPSTTSTETKGFDKKKWVLLH